MAYNKQRIKDLMQEIRSGDLYDCMDADWAEYQHEIVQRMYEYNHTPETPEGLKRREEILRETLGTYGENLCILPPVHANCALVNLHVGKNVYINFNCTFVDDIDIYIGDYCLIGPSVSFATAIHPLSPRLRKQGLQCSRPIRLGSNVWVGAGAIILPGVTVGDNAVIGAGSVVTKDVEANTIVVGNPARVLRKITEEDDKVCAGREIKPHILARLNRE